MPQGRPQGHLLLTSNVLILIRNIQNSLPHYCYLPTQLELKIAQKRVTLSTALGDLA